MMTSYTMTINGKSIESEQTFEVINPATGSSFADCPDCMKSQLDDAMESALRAFPEWGKDRRSGCRLFMRVRQP